MQPGELKLTTITCYERALYGKLCATPLKTAGLITTVLEDKNGDAVLVGVQSAISMVASDAEVAARFPLGQLVAIKEPSFRTTQSGILQGTVFQDNAIRNPSAEGYKPCLLCIAVQTWEALQTLPPLYCCANMGSLTNPASFVLLCKHGKPVTTSIRGLESPQSEEDAILCDCSLDLANPGSYLFYLKRAKLRLGQEKWVKASKDLKAIETKVPESERIAYQLMRVQALLGMECHAEAKNILDSLHPPDVSFSLGPVPKRSGSLLETEIDKRRKVMERQGIAGEYELDSYLAVGVEERPTELQCSEYAQFFTIEYNPDQDRTSRGVYACKWLQPGKLVLASTAIVMVKESPAYGKISISMDPYSVSGFPGALSPWQEEIITKLVPRMQECPKVARQMLSLQDWPSRGTSRAEMPVAHSGGETTQPHRSKPDLSLLSSFCTPAVEEDCREPSEYASNGVAIDINRLRRIVAINSFRKPGSGESGGIWTIPSFFNHSCTPNCSWHIVGDTMFISASKKLVPRDQLKLSYFNVASTWFFRKENAEANVFLQLC